MPGETKYYLKLDEMISDSVFNGRLLKEICDYMEINEIDGVGEISLVDRLGWMKLITR